MHSSTASVSSLQISVASDNLITLPSTTRDSKSGESQVTTPPRAIPTQLPLFCSSIQETLLSNNSINSPLPWLNPYQNKVILKMYIATLHTINMNKIKFHTNLLTQSDFDTLYPNSKEFIIDSEKNILYMAHVSREWCEILPFWSFALNIKKGFTAKCTGSSWPLKLNTILVMSLSPQTSNAVSDLQR